MALAMFVAEGAVQKLRKKRQDQFYTNYISSLIDEARRLGISSEECHCHDREGGFLNERN